MSQLNLELCSAFTYCPRFEINPPHPPPPPHSALPAQGLNSSTRYPKLSACASFALKLGGRVIRPRRAGLLPSLAGGLGFDAGPGSFSFGWLHCFCLELQILLVRRCWRKSRPKLSHSRFFVAGLGDGFHRRGSREAAASTGQHSAQSRWPRRARRHAAGTH